MREYHHDSYYLSSRDSRGSQEEIKKNTDLTKLKFIDVHLSIKIAIERFLSNLLFKGNLKRILYSSQDITFRKRIEYLDNKNSYNEEEPIKPESLDLPFASYMNTSDPEPDDRPNSTSAAQAIIGEWDENLEVSVRSLAVKQTFKVIVFYARQDEVRLAQQLLLWEKSPSFPIRYYHTVKWRGCNLSLPVNITIESINTNPGYNEMDWLTKNRIFPIEIELSVRSYQVLVNTIENLCQLPIRFSNVIDTYNEFDPPTEYITEEVILNWANEKFDIDTDNEKVDFESDDIQQLLRSPYYFNQKAKDIPEGDLLQSFANLPNNYTTDVVQGYFLTDSSVSLNYIKYDINKQTNPTEAIIDFMVKPATFKYFDYLELLVPLKPPVIVKDCKLRNAVITGLVQNSEYRLTANVHAIDGSIKTYFLDIHTKAVDTATQPDKTPTSEKINKTPGLVGMRLF